MLHFVSHGTMLAGDISVSIGGHTYYFGTNVIVYLVVAALAGLIAEFLVGWRLPFGIIGAIIAGVIGVWLMTEVIIVGGFSDYNIAGVPIIRALIGAIILVALWHLLTYRTWHRRRRYYYRRRY
jgi:uncharacterized membrane protein YeaQ/YmgE (transglycosylase-associated protein family)